MRRNTVHESQTRSSQAKFLLVLLVLKFTAVAADYILYHDSSRGSCSCGLNIVP
jgi:hypothetical protein